MINVSGVPALLPKGLFVPDHRTASFIGHGSTFSFSDRSYYSIKSNRYRSTSGLMQQGWGDSTRAALSWSTDWARLSPSPILTVHSLSTQTGYRSAGPCSKQNSQHLQDVTLFPHSVPGQKGWQKVLQKPNTYKKRKSIIPGMGTQKET